MINAIIIIIVVLFDQISKYLVQSQITLQNVQIIDNFFYLTYVGNTGAAWSIFSGNTGILALVSAVAVGLMVWYIVAKKPSKWTQIGLSLMIAGALGNLIDRLFIGFVRDFLNFYIFGYDFPIFNVADISLCVGVGILILVTFLEDDA